MSMELMAKAMKVKVGNPLRKLVLLKLADNANDLGECWPSIPYIAEQCEISPRSVQNHIKGLESSGLLWIEFRKSASGNNKSNIFHLTLNNKSALDNEKPSLDTGAGDAPPPAGDAPHGAADSPPPGAGAAPRTSHSFEPINESINEQKRSRKQKTVFVLPDGLNLEAWGLWLEYRKQSNMKAYAPTPMSAGVQAEKLISLSGGDLKTQMMIVQQSINGPWSGLFPLKKTGAGAESKILQAQRAAEQAIADGRVGYDYDTPFGQR